METSFLLELSKLASARLDLATYIQLATDVMVQFLPVDACFLRVDVAGLPAARAAVGLGGADSPDEADLILEAVHQGLRGVRLLDVSSAAIQETQRGHTHAEALARIRSELPNVPAPPPPPRTTVQRARRPVASGGQQPLR